MEAQLSPWEMETRSGRIVNLLEPKGESIDAGDIAFALAGIFRFTGHTRLTVAQHSVHVSKAIGLSIEGQRWGILHDAHEAYVGDCSRPYQEAMRRFAKNSRDSTTFYQWVRVDLDDAIQSRFRVTPSEQDRRDVKLADLSAVRDEGRWLFPSAGRNWPSCWGTEETPKIVLWDGVVWSPEEAEKRFLERIQELGIE